MTREQQTIESERARLIMNNLGWIMTKLEFTPTSIVISFEKVTEEKKE